ncbi:MAG: DUF2344 domain-containing protein [Clostridia bacterium]|nr:DUF2344 domain-containing protein [Clostridia bacterium]
MRMLALFEKGERLRHIGHLDIMRAMQRALRRSSLPVSYSKGFNPHILLGFASAMPVGAVGKCELMEVELDSDVDAGEFEKRMNEALPEDLKVFSCRPLPPHGPALMAQVCAASWHLKILDDDLRRRVQESIPSFLEKDEIPAMKKTKSGEKEVNIRPMILHLEAEEDGTLDMTLQMEESQSCKPSMLLESLLRHNGIQDFSVRYALTRDHLLGRHHDTLCYLEDIA